MLRYTRYDGNRNSGGSRVDLSALQQKFGLPGVLAFDQQDGLVRCLVTTKQASATVYLQGAHVTAWQPAGAPPCLFLSRKSAFAVGKPIRGGIPVVFPWFAADSKPDRVDGHPGPMHGFARIQDWTLESARVDFDEFEMHLSLGPTEMSRSMGYDDFLLRLELRFGKELALKLTVVNIGPLPMSFEQALHTYFHVTDIHETTMTGLEDTAYIDKTDGFEVKPASGASVTFTGPVDRVYQGTTADVRVRDGAGGRSYTLHKTGSKTTVVFNPGAEMPDVGAWEWHELACAETANVGENLITLAPGATALMGARISVAVEARG